MKNICGFKQQKFGEVWMPKKHVLVFTTQKGTNLEDVLEQDNWTKEVSKISKFVDMVVFLKILAHTIKQKGRSHFHQWKPSF